MEPSTVSDFVRIIEGGGNAALIVATVFLYRAVKSLIRIETFMSTLFEVLLRSEGVQMRASDIEILKGMRADMTSRHRDKGFAMKPLLWILTLLLGFGAAIVAFAQVAPDAARLTWQNATQLTDGTPIPATGPKSLKTTRIQRSTQANCATGAFTPIAQTLNVPASNTTALFENLTPVGRKHCFRARHILTDDSLGNWSAVVAKDITEPPPPPPPASARAPAITIE